jgi:hypothetical protein
MSLLRRLALVAVPVIFFGCSQAPAPGQASSSSDEITEEEIAGITASNAYEVIRKLRANFLSFRGRTTVMGTSSPDPTVYVDDQLYGPISSLRTIPAAQITRIRLYRSWEATTRYGTGNMGGVIAVSTKQ